MYENDIDRILDKEDVVRLIWFDCIDLIWFDCVGPIMWPDYLARLYWPDCIGPITWSD